ncbi:nicotinamide riboside transporter PnuC [Streptomyces sp. NBC_01618]|uniref:nicotinamide riboside transporter PnuC n=1 Tax=Streptomyces sp. NBC_01618 TaxID=2975900 RepID=UPI0038678B28|nr:nicotinamide riboside transporter PnuC [Streptomyces sp. NBC_01618]
MTVIGTPVSWTEVLGFGSGALCVWLVARQHLANWPIGITNNLFFILLFTQSGLYADAGLQIVFIALAAYGWWTWTHGGGPGAPDLPVRRTTRTEWTWLLAAGAVGTVALTALLAHATDSTVPFWDALTTALSLTATYGQCRKLVEETADRVAHHLWLLTDHEGVAFEDDGLRDGEELRPWMTDRFRAELTRTGRRFVELTGTHQERLATAVGAVDTLLAAGWNFAAPLPEHR